METIQVGNGIANFASILDPNARAQAIETAKLSIVWPYLALMPDAHWGRGATVGSVIPTVDAIIPAAVGVDIGCGMIAVRTQFLWEDVEPVLPPAPKLRDLHTAIANAIPLSAGKYNQRLTSTAVDRISILETMPGIAQAEIAAPNWRMQLGSLGSGNHFIEVSLDDQERVWLFLHSGSRGVGNKLATKWINAAKDYCKLANIWLPNKDLAYLREGDVDFQGYIEALYWAQKFALLNRAEMMDRVVACFEQWIGKSIDRKDEINCHHNYTAREQCAGSLVWLSRKGAIDAHSGVRGLIPGSMGASSYVVRGKGNPLALHSSPHGAGRMYGRASAKQRFTYEDLQERMRNVVWGDSASFLDEHPLAYKPIDIVMKDAEDMVEVENTLTQIVNVKGA